MLTAGGQLQLVDFGFGKFGPCFEPFTSNSVERESKNRRARQRQSQA